MSVLGDAGDRPSKLGRYELITQIGQGGMAEVQLAIQRGPAGFEKLVVVKLVHANLATQKSFVDMLLDEARVAALVKHPNVVDIYDLGEAEGRYFIAMEYLEGEPLLAVLRAGREGKRLDPLSTARLVADTAEGLDAAHELRTMGGEPIELVHHDVSLGNIVVLYNGQVKLVDFGVAKATSAAGGAARTKVQGKFSYMAPEKLRGGAGDRRSDIWSLGCVLWEALTLRRLFKGGNDSETMRQVLESELLAPSKVNGDVPTDFDRIVMRALERDADLRYPTAKEMAADLEEVLREHKYGGKNDVIAKYMQATFESHIIARKKLLQEVSSKGRASADVLEAAFNEPMLASGSPINTTGEFSVKFRRTSSEIPAMPDHTPARGRSPSSPPEMPMPIAPRSTGQLPAYDDAAPPPEGGGTTAHAPASKHRVVLAIGGGAVLVTVLAIVLAMRGGREPARVSPPAETAPAPVHAVVPAAPDAAAAPIDPAVGPAVGSAQGSDIDMAVDVGSDAGSAVAAGSATTATGSAAGSAKATAREPRPRTEPKPEKADAEGLFKTGLQAYVRGDAKTAVMSFKRALQANPSFAPTWRALGHAYEKLGDPAQAKGAFQHYLQLAPTAPDAAQVRARMDGL